MPGVIKRILIVSTIIVMGVILISCSPAQETSSSEESTSFGNGMTVKEVGIVYEGVQLAKDYVVSNRSTLQNEGTLSQNNGNGNYGSYSFLKDCNCPVASSTDLKTVLIKKGSVHIDNYGAPTHTRGIKGNLVINGKEYVVSYSVWAEVPSLLVNGVQVY